MELLQPRQTESHENETIFSFPLLPSALACSVFAQVDRPLIKNRPDAPIANSLVNSLDSYKSA
jgi:hypothetical protein